MTTKLSAEKLEQVRSALAENPGGMTMQLAQQLSVPEAEIIRELPDGRGVELDIARWEELFTAFTELGKVHGSVTCETVGEFGGFSTWGEFFNVQSKTLDMHIRYERLGSVFAVEKPSHMDGGKTLSVQFFDTKGDSALKVFVNFAGKPTTQRERQFTQLRDRFQRNQ
jgi:putative hemin transport protein